MDIEKLINQMRFYGSELGATPLNNIIGKYMLQVATALSTLQAENEKLRAELEAIKTGVCNGCSVPVVNAETLRDLKEAPELRAELEQVKRQRDKAVEHLRGQCRYCKRNLVCTSRKGPHTNCWEWRGPEKED